MYGWLATLSFVFVAWAAPAAAHDLQLSGATMGTTWSLRIAAPASELAAAQLEAAIAALLARVDAQMSTYRDDSEIERFNRARSTNWQAVSAETVHVARAAREIAERSRGAFDPTVGPLVRAWGFGRASAESRPAASAAEVSAAHARVGYARLHVREHPPALRKDSPEVELDLSAIAKGYAVDALAELLLERGVERFLVEIGGELRGRGTSPRGVPWLVEIESVLPGTREPPLRVALRDAAIATSGPYRSFRVHEAARLSHLIDPRTGAPVESDLVSVSVIASSAMYADAWATALLVAGPDEGWRLAQSEGLAALFVSLSDGRQQRRATHSFDEHRSDRAPSRAGEQP